MIDEGQLIAMKILFDIREWDIAKSLAKLDTLLKNCHEANYKYFFLVNFKYAKLLFKQVQSLDTSTFFNTNQALQRLQLSQKYLARAIGAAEKAADRYAYQHEQDEKVAKLKEDQEKLIYNF